MLKRPYDITQKDYLAIYIMIQVLNCWSKENIVRATMLLTCKEQFYTLIDVIMDIFFCKHSLEMKWVMRNL